MDWHSGKWAALKSHFMLRAIFYLALIAGGVGATFLNPLYGGITCLLAYLLNPPVVMAGSLDFRFQFWATAAFLASFLIHRHRRAARLGSAGWQPLFLIWLFVAIGALSAAWAVYSSTEALNAIYEVFKTMLMITVLVSVVQTEKDMTMIMSACIVGAWHAAVMHTFGIKWGYVPHAFGREFGVLPDGQAGVMLLFFPLTLLAAVIGKTKRERWLGRCALPFVLDSIVSTYMRAAFVGLAVEAVAILFLLPKRLVLWLTPVMIAVGGLFFYVLTPADYWERVDTILTPHEEASANSRFTINAASWEMLKDYPMGVGYRNYPDVSPRYLPASMLTDGRRSAHNSYFSVACETGFLGFFLWASGFIGALVLCRKIRKNSDFRNLSSIAIYAMAIETGLLGWMAEGCFQAEHEVDPAYWFVGFAVILTRLHKALRAQAPELHPEPVGDSFVLGPVKSLS